MTSDNNHQRAGMAAVIENGTVSWVARQIRQSSTKRRVLNAVAIAIALPVLLASGSAQSIANAAQMQFGVGLTPAHFPRQTGEDVAQMYKQAGKLGSYVVLNYTWDQPNYLTVATQMIQLARRAGLIPIVQLSVLDAKGRPAAPGGAGGSSFADSAVADAYITSVKELAALNPDYLAIGTDMNRLLAGGPDRLKEFAALYQRAYDASKQVAPGTKVYITFSWDLFAGAAEQHSLPVTRLSPFVKLFRPKLDVLAFDSMPSMRFPGPGGVPAGYYAPISDFAGNGEPIFLQVGWPAANGGLAAQSAFIRRVPALLGGLEPRVLLWPLLHDLDAGPPAFSTIGLYTSQDVAKPAIAALGAIIADGRPQTAPSGSPSTVARADPTAVPERKEASDKFAVWASTLSGETPRLLLSDPKREINHARVSPDGSQMVMTRYNVFGSDGEALETNGYFKTEIILCRSDGTDCKSMIPPRDGVINGNANWTADGRGILFVSSDTPSGDTAIKRLDVASGAITTFFSPKNIYVLEPHMVGGWVALPGRLKSSPGISRLFLVNASTKSVRQLTDPQFKEFTRTEPPLGDYDPKLSPNGNRVAVMRHPNASDWHIVIVDVASGTERNLSKPHAVDAVPEWSSDGKLLIFWSVDRSDLKKSGLYVMALDGSNRQRVPLPHGYFYTMPEFVPGSGSGPDARIVYSTKVEARL